MSYALYDFTETLQIAGVAPQTIERVLYGFGTDGDCSEWEGGFVFRTKEGAIGMVSGWCDTTGWGCQDGAKLAWFASVPTDQEIIDAYNDAWASDGYGHWPEEQQIDHDPADLNRWVTAGCPDVYEWSNGRA